MIVGAVGVLAFLAPAAAAESSGDTVLEEAETTADGYGTLDAEKGPYGTFDIALEPTDGELAPGEVTTYEVVVYGATNGIKGYLNIELVLDDPSVAQFVNFTETATEIEGEDEILSESEIQDANGDAAEEGPALYLAAGLTVPC